jgi:hypothetical protein
MLWSFTVASLKVFREIKWRTPDGAAPFSFARQFTPFLGAGRHFFCTFDPPRRSSLGEPLEPHVVCFFSPRLSNLFRCLRMRGAIGVNRFKGRNAESVAGGKVRDVDYRRPFFRSSLVFVWSGRE